LGQSLGQFIEFAVHNFPLVFVFGFGLLQDEKRNVAQKKIQGFLNSLYCANR